MTPAELLAATDRWLAERRWADVPAGSWQAVQAAARQLGEHGHELPPLRPWRVNIGTVAFLVEARTVDAAIAKARADMPYPRVTWGDLARAQVRRRGVAYARPATADDVAGWAAYRQRVAVG